MVVRPHLLPFGPHHTISLVSFFRSALDTVYITLQPWIIEQYCALFVFWYISLFLYLMTCNFDTFFFFWGGGLFTCWWIDIACSSFCLQTSGISWYDSKTKRKHRADSSGPVLWDSLKAVHQFPFFPNCLCCQALKSKRIKFWLHWSHPYLVVSHVATSMFLKDRWTFLAVLLKTSQVDTFEKTWDWLMVYRWAYVIPLHGQSFKQLWTYIIFTAVAPWNMPHPLREFVLSMWSTTARRSRFLWVHAMFGLLVRHLAGNSTC